jgi:hypothetical protein
VNGTAQLWMNQTQLEPEAFDQLNTVDIRSYQSFLSDLLILANENYISTLWISPSASQAIYSRIPAQKRLVSSKFQYFI